jgi:hypothetical protein
MWEPFAKTPELLIPLAAIVCGAIVGLVAIIAHQWRAVRRTEMELALKQDMLNRGLSVEEIERILRASGTPPEEPAKPDPITDNEYAFVEKMVEEGRTAAEVERLVTLLRSTGGGMSDNEYALIEKMLEEGKTVEEIERVIRAFRTTPAAPTAAPGAADPERPRETAILRMDV